MAFVQKLASWRDTGGNQWFFSMVWLMCFPLAEVFCFDRHGGNFVLTAFFVSVLAIAATEVRREYVRFLAARADANHSIQWDVLVNGVKGGEIADATYVRLRLAVYAENAVWAAQFKRYVSRVTGTVCQFGFVMPAGLAWFAIAIGIFRPADLYHFVSAAANAGIPDIRSASLVLVQVAILTTGLACFTALITSRRSPTAVVEREVGLRVRRALGVVADGEVSLVRYENSGEPVLYCEDERTERRNLQRERRAARKVAKKHS